MDSTINRLNQLLKRMAYALAGLVAGDALLLLYLMQNALRVRSALITANMGEPAREIPNALQSSLFFALFSFVGFLVVGVPTILLFSGRSIARLTWPLTLIVGSILGPLALLAILLVLGHGYIYLSSDLTESAMLFVYSALISTVAFAVYAALLRAEFRKLDSRNSPAPLGASWPTPR